MLVTLALPTVPEALETVQVWEGPEGWPETVTRYRAPAGRGVAKVKDPFPLIASVSPPLFRSSRPEPDRPLTVPPMVKRGCGSVVQLTATPVTSASPMTPEPLAMVQVCPVGCTRIVTA